MDVVELRDPTIRKILKFCQNKPRSLREISVHVSQDYYKVRRLCRKLEHRKFIVRSENPWDTRVLLYQTSIDLEHIAEDESIPADFKKAMGGDYLWVASLTGKVYTLDDLVSKFLNLQEQETFSRLAKIIASVGVRSSMLQEGFGHTGVAPIKSRRELVGMKEFLEQIADILEQLILADKLWLDDTKVINLFADYPENEDVFRMLASQWEEDQRTAHEETVETG